MEILFVVIVVIIVAVYFSPFFLESVQASFPYYNSLMRVRYTIIFGGIGLLYGIAGNQMDIKDFFLGMIAGSFIDFQLRPNRHQ
ncbi:hypothetical protein J2S78_002400 [Salibacterium salarium]|uniref:Bacteriophage A118-like holin, Hol118 n=1 Tax=Salibacterium salarium TaxID=284579 RepID=A0A428N9F4_9BACI|nr:hypothetical protein [Salibacterium salarium]MDQ0299953.1 hypothetical protein [Salibacterium salarium]RSL34970.1 hypothetical protein D7Z54_03855 [Salibacterium salarium]